MWCEEGGDVVELEKRGREETMFVFVVPSTLALNGSELGRLRKCIDSTVIKSVLFISSGLTILYSLRLCITGLRMLT